MKHTVITTAVFAALLLGSCTDSPTAIRHQISPMSPPIGVARTYGPGFGNGYIRSQIAPDRFATVRGGTAAAETRVEINSFSGSVAQTFDWRLTGEIRALDGTWCLQPWGASSGAVGEPILIERCDGSAGQQWQWTTGGQIQGNTGLCWRTEQGGSSIGLPFTLATCSSGDLSQEIELLPVAAPAPGSVANVSVTPASVSMRPRDVAQLSASLTDAAGNALTGRVITWSSSAPAVATVDTTGQVLALAAGTATITATSEGKSGIALITVTTTGGPGFGSGYFRSEVASDRFATVRGGRAAAETRIEINSFSGSVAQTFDWRVTGEIRALDGTWCLQPWGGNSGAVGQPVLIERCDGSAGQNWRWTAGGQIQGNTGLCWRTQQGGSTIGLPFVLATCNSGDLAQRITLQSTTTKVSLSLRSAALTPGDTETVQALVTDAQGNVLANSAVTFASSDTSVASIASNGLVTARGSGTTQLSATSNGSTGTATLTVSPAAVATVTLVLNSSTIAVGQGTQATATLKDANGNILTGRSVAYSSSDTMLAKVSNTGYVTAVAAGIAVITAVSEGVSGSATLTTTAAAPTPVTSVTVTLNSTALRVGQSTQAVVTLKDANGNTLSGRTVTFASSNTTVATVASTGLVSALAAGTSQITATSEGQSGSASLTVQAVAPPPVATVTVTLVNSSLTAGQTTQTVVTLKDATGATLTGRAITYTSSNASVATVASAGMVSALAAGTAQITATSEGKSGSATLTVQAAPPPPLPGFPHEPAGFTRVLEHSFDQMPGTSGTGTDYIISGGAWNNWTYANTTITDDGTAPFSPSRVIQVTWPKGLNDGERQGTGIDGRFGADYREVYISMRFKILGTTFENQNVGAKILGYVNYGGYERDNQFYWLLKERDWASGDGPGGIRTGPFFLESRVSYPYTQVYGTTAVRGVQYLANNQGTGNTVLPGQWVHMEAYFKLNTKNADGSYNRDGVVKQWINGVLVQSYNNVDWLTPSTTSLGDHGFYGWHFDPIWGGNDGQIKTRDDNMYIDHVYISGIKQ